jgi:hypothetical protein
MAAHASDRLWEVADLPSSSDEPDRPTIVVSPLVALVAGPERALGSHRVPVVVLHGRLRRTSRRAGADPRRRPPGRPHVRTTPETLEAGATARCFEPARPAFLYMDEAHCISERGISAAVQRNLSWMLGTSLAALDLCSEFGRRRRAARHRRPGPWRTAERAVRPNRGWILAAAQRKSARDRGRLGSA